jgi:DNA-binding HxlR family transcriptional regulator
MISSIQIAILKAIQANDGKLNWYQLDRELTQRLASGGSTAVSEVLMPGLRELEQADFITTVAGHHPAQPLYSITVTGQQLLEAHEARDGEMTVPSNFVNKSR